MQQPVLPSEVRIDDQAIRVLWDDGHSGIYPHRYLRLKCQCANCINEITGRPTLDPETVPQDVKAVDHMQVGNYGLQFSGATPTTPESTPTNFCAPSAPVSPATPPAAVPPRRRRLTAPMLNSKTPDRCLCPPPNFPHVCRH